MSFTNDFRKRKILIQHEAQSNQSYNLLILKILLILFHNYTSKRNHDWDWYYLLMEIWDRYIDTTLHLIQVALNNTRNVSLTHGSDRTGHPTTQISQISIQLSFKNWRLLKNTKPIHVYARKPVHVNPHTHNISTFVSQRTFH